MDAYYGASHMGCHIYFNYQGANFGDMETIGARIRSRRLELGIRKQADLGQQVGLDQSSISDIEKHNVGFSASVLIKLSRVLHLTPESTAFFQVTASNAGLKSLLFTTPTATR